VARLGSGLWVNASGGDFRAMALYRVADGIWRGVAYHGEAGLAVAVRIAGIDCGETWGGGEFRYTPGGAKEDSCSHDGIFWGR
jgi:hypothetical protein